MARVVFGMTIEYNKISIFVYIYRLNLTQLLGSEPTTHLDHTPPRRELNA
jgi:hypothetical protein